MSSEIEILNRMFQSESMSDPKFRNNFVITLFMHAEELQSLMKIFVAGDDEIYEGKVEVSISNLTNPDNFSSTMSRFVEWQALAKKYKEGAKAQFLVHWKDGTVIKTVYVEMNILHVYHAVDLIKEKNGGKVNMCASFNIVIKYNPQLSEDVIFRKYVDQDIYKCFCGDW